MSEGCDLGCGAGVALVDSPFGSMGRTGVVSVHGVDMGTKAYWWTDLEGNELLTYEVKTWLSLSSGGRAVVPDRWFLGCRGGKFIVQFTSGEWLWSEGASSWRISPHPLDAPLDTDPGGVYYSSGVPLGEYSSSDGSPSVIVSLDNSWWRGWLKKEDGLFHPVGGTSGKRRVGYGKMDAEVSGVSMAPLPWREEFGLWNGKPFYRQAQISSAPTFLWNDGMVWKATYGLGVEDKVNEGVLVGGGSVAGDYHMEYEEAPSVVDDYEPAFGDPPPGYMCLTAVVTPPSLPLRQPLPSGSYFGFGSCSAASSVARQYYPTSMGASFWGTSCSSMWRLSRILSNKGTSTGPFPPSEWFDGRPLVMQAVFAPRDVSMSVPEPGYDPGVLKSLRSPLASADGMWSEP